MVSLPAALEALVQRYDSTIFEPARRGARVRLQGCGLRSWDVVFDGGPPRVGPADSGRRADAVLTADDETWRALGEDLAGGMAAFRSGRLTVRRDLHLGVGFLAATAAASGPGRLRFHQVQTAGAKIAVMEAGEGPPVLLLHGLGATKASFLPTLAALAGSHRAIAIDLPGFGDSDKPLRAAYDPAFFAGSAVALLDALGIGQADVAGNSMGGRAALELGLTAPDRVGRLVLLTPSLAWLRSRPWAAPLRLVAPQLGLIQPAPRAIVEGLVRRLIPTQGSDWTAAGVDEFLRSYLSPSGRAAFYAAARNIYLESPRGENGFWTRLGQLEPESLFVWGSRDQIVPVGFARHVHEALPQARHLVLDCGHVPQMERPAETHRAMLSFLAGRRVGHSAVPMAA
ncbi:MAG: alpha/beta fold hydrolase [Actinomycetota bacterium]|nr:alpha/beta fold hydrolase [Actinomycetota bacterium]